MRMRSQKNKALDSQTEKFASYVQQIAGKTLPPLSTVDKERIRQWVNNHLAHDRDALQMDIQQLIQKRNIPGYPMIHRIHSIKVGDNRVDINFTRNDALRSMDAETSILDLSLREGFKKIYPKKPAAYYEKYYTYNTESGNFIGLQFKNKRDLFKFVNDMNNYLAQSFNLLPSVNENTEQKRGIFRPGGF